MLTSFYKTAVALSRLPRFYNTVGYSLPLLTRRRLHSVINIMADFPYQVGYPAEELSKYCPGGYHPIHLGDVYKAGRYRIVHKLGWGGYSTVWLARDQNTNRNVALKVNVSDAPPVRNELGILQQISQLSFEEPSTSFSAVVKYLDDFQIEGPNGFHHCIVTELLGPSIITALAQYDFPSNRLPARWAKGITRQLLTTLGSLHRHGIAHGGKLMEKT